MGERIALGLGDNTDYEITWDSHVFEGLIRDQHITSSELSMDRPISDTRELVISILCFLKNEAGGERFVSSPQLVEDFAGRFQRKVTLGGTAVRAAIAMRKLGFTSALHLVTINDHVRTLVPADCRWVCSNDKDSSFPHLIVQFRAGTIVESGDIAIRTKWANRVIYHHDQDNINLELNPAFASLLTRARVFLISGFNAMHDSAVLADRLERLKEIMRSLPSDALVFYEDACFYEQALSRQVHAALLDAIDVFSMNEDELQGYAGRKVSLLDPDDVYAALRDVSQLLPVPAIVVHTRFWCLVYGADAARYAKALGGGLTMATTRFRFGDDFTPTDYQGTEELPAESIGARFATRLGGMAGDRVCCLPALDVKARDVTTIGLGDAFVGGFLPALAER
jgi:ADP-dependent phosphofructokinase/glucokinase